VEYSFGAEHQVAETEESARCLNALEYAGRDQAGRMEAQDFWHGHVRDGIDLRGAVLMRSLMRCR